MPEYQGHLQLPRPPVRAEPEMLRQWAEDLVQALGNSWQSMVYVLNALSTTDTIANRPATPALNHILYTASDTGETFVAVGGVWVPVNIINRRGANGQRILCEPLDEEHTLAAAAFSDTTIQWPAASLALGYVHRVTTLITGCATLDVGVAGATTRYGTGLTLTAGSTNTSPGTTNPSIYAAATSLRFSAVGGGGAFTAGVIRTTLYPLTFVAPTS